VVQRQARLLAQWMHLGFIHGVMNTDNMTISGETIDYGPCAYMEAYDPATVFSSIDHQGRYAYARQPGIAQWNLAVLAQALLPLIHDQEEEGVRLATEVVNGFAPAYYAALRAGHRAKLGLQAPSQEDEALDEADQALVGDWLDLLQAQKVDHTLAWFHLADAVAQPATGVASRQAQLETPLHTLFAQHEPLDAWLARWHTRCGHAAESAVDAARRRAQMLATNPWLIPRNALVEQALSAATAGELRPFEELLAAVQRPFGLRPELERYARPSSAAEAAGYQTFCGT
jgi:serine/tyrosine/threonine adenylyltransferase